MGTATLLQNINAVVDELGLPSVTSVIGSRDTQVRQLLAFANREGAVTSTFSFGAKMGWQAMVKTATITLVDGQADYNLPTDVVTPVTMTFWDVNYRWQLLGPLSPQEWDVLVYGISPAGPRRRFRIKNNQMSINPTPGSADAGNTLVFEYYSNAWCQSAAGVGQTKFAADTDTYVLDDDSLVLGIKWRFLRAKGLDYTEEKALWADMLLRAMARDGADRYLPTNAQARQDTQLLSENNVPDTGFGQ